MSASVAGESGVSNAMRVKRKRSSGALNSIQQLKDDAEEMMLNKILAHLKGKESLQMWVLHMLEKGALQKQCQVSDPGDRSVSQSNNKFNLITIQDWSEVLEVVDPLIFSKELTKSATKQQLVEYGSFVAGIDASSALPSRKVKVVGNFMKTRAQDLFGNRHQSLQLVTQGPDHKRKLVQQVWAQNGVFKQERMVVRNEDGTEETQAMLVHVCSGARVPWPAE
eukprot:3432402-Amphidinium_carterae.1